MIRPIASRWMSDPTLERYHSHALILVLAVVAPLHAGLFYCTNAVHPQLQRRAWRTDGLRVRCPVSGVSIVAQ
jgi:hypothetical protein